MAIAWVPRRSSADNSFEILRNTHPRRTTRRAQRGRVKTRHELRRRAAVSPSLRHLPPIMTQCYERAEEYKSEYIYHLNSRACSRETSAKDLACRVSAGEVPHTMPSPQYRHDLNPIPHPQNRRSGPVHDIAHVSTLTTDIPHTTRTARRRLGQILHVASFFDALGTSVMLSSC
ncbi:uncharacterized protein SCHCODRAFT_02284278 [Schizophyllum commune H4-8]|uniref:uncharacterized protein n=1 Tax=Schizophyllum commune (strain H4-8 / FGSC 9210) TaxID=578458 RepID=UPI00215F6B91|nr:uncharacterized protein SCHCODRAFT_02284278 [Schizophyllum commune H4-8]KAI5892138.1 hypothetical protein SCHCODRAFT_02284278 [Schizophyllum commune H4-8]